MRLFKDSTSPGGGSAATGAELRSLKAALGGESDRLLPSQLGAVTGGGVGMASMPASCGPRPASARNGWTTGAWPPVTLPKLNDWLTVLRT